MNYRRLIPTVFILIIAACSGANATTVSGGIYTNTTWTLANSPYIVMDTVVVFPNVVLTIEPGVVVKFQNNKLLEIRGGQLNAIGTATDSITFTSVSLTPAPGIWSSVYLYASNNTTFRYCNFSYASIGINDCGNLTQISHSNFSMNVTGAASTSCGCCMIVDTCVFTNNTTALSAPAITIRNSNFRLNHYAIESVSGFTIENCVVNANMVGINCSYEGLITACVIDSNSQAAIEFLAGGSTVTNSEIKYNNVGIDASQSGQNTISGNIITDNATGILIRDNGGLYCNRISNNYLYDLRCTSASNITATYNDWSTSDSTSTAAVIYDGYDNVSLGLVQFMPLDTIQCYVNGSNCHAHFTVYPDTMVQHNWIAVNQSTGFFPLRYSWTWGDGTFTHDTIATPSHTYNTPGFYNICLNITDLTGCTSSYCDSSVYLYRTSNAETMITINVLLPTGVTVPLPTTFSLDIYPNPVTDILNISKSNDEPVEFTMEDIMGRVLLQRKFENSVVVNMFELESGIYLYRVSAGKNLLKTGIIVKD